jgi:hypothetical protein
VTKRVCSTPGCPSLTDGGPCDEHRRQRDKARGSSTARGYGAAHQAERAAWDTIIESGAQVYCRRCRELIRPGMAWDLGHTEDRKHTHPEHQACNRATAKRT